MSRRILAAIAIALLSVPARAHEDPTGCFEVGADLELLAFRSDGTSLVSGPVTGCEQIFYRATLREKAELDSLCAFSGGSVTLTTPDGVGHVFADVPCIGGNTGLEGCFDVVNFVDFGLVPYAVTATDAARGNIAALAVYTGGVVHDSASNTPGVFLSVPKGTPVVACEGTTTVTTSSSTTSTTLPAKSACAALKVDAAFQLGADLGACDSRALKLGVAVREECRAAALASFQRSWAMAERRNDCLTSGDESGVAAVMRECAGAVEGALIR